MRRDLDQWLLEAAVRAGARFDPGRRGPSAARAEHPLRVVGVQSTCGRREYTFRARVVIAADGRASRLATSLGLARFAKRRSGGRTARTSRTSMD